MSGKVPKDLDELIAILSRLFNGRGGIPAGIDGAGADDNQLWTADGLDGAGWEDALAIIQEVLSGLVEVTASLVVKLSSGVTPLIVETTGDTVGILIRTGLTGALNIRVYDGAGYDYKFAAFYNQTSNTGVAFGGSGFLVLWISPGKNVGIGIQTPLARLHVVTQSTINIGLIVQGVASQTANLIEARNSSNSILFAVEAAGKIRTNQAAANTNTPSGATAYQMPIYNSSGTLLGYIPIYGSAW